MEKSLILNAEARDRAGTKDAKKLREKGRIPAIIYGHKEKPISVSLDAHDLVEGIHHGHRIADIKMGGKKQKVIFKELQYDYLGQNIIHADLVRVDVTERVHVEVPIELKGTAKGTEENGIIETHLARLEIECLVTNIPEAIVVPIKELNVGQSLHAGDVELPPNISLITEPSALLVTCSMLAAAPTTEELEEEAPAAPEVISEAKEEEQEESKESK